EGETHARKTALVEATTVWRAGACGGGVPCPVAFAPEHVRETTELGAELQVVGENVEGTRGLFGFEAETWVPSEHYEMAVALAGVIKQGC
ncbi:hypothetical protein HYPSUDRAFT_144442, partial [Hypholoma sublateritium FD-334 SS-4]